MVSLDRTSSDWNKSTSEWINGQVKFSGCRHAPGRRALQAEQTRLEILGAARRLFAAEGYAATTLRHIASEAGVSVQTVFNSVGSKAELVRRLNDVIDREAGVGELAAGIATSTDPLGVAAIPARISCRIIDRCGDLVRISLDAARSEKELAEVGARVGDGTARARRGSLPGWPDWMRSPSTNRPQRPRSPRSRRSAWRSPCWTTTGWTSRRSSSGSSPLRCAPWWSCRSAARPRPVQHGPGSSPGPARPGHRRSR